MTENRRGAAWMTCAMAGYVINDAFIKLAAEDLPLFQSIFLRGVMITVILYVIAQRRGDLVDFRSKLSRPLLIRLSTEAVATIFYLLALTNVPLSGLTAVMQIIPIAVVFVAARMLHEPVSTYRVLAVIGGFIGVLLIVRPGSADFSPWFLAGFGAVVMVVTREIATVSIPSSASALYVAFCTAVTIMSMGLAISIFQGWASPTGRDLGLLFLAGVFLCVGYISSVVTIRVGDLSYSAPFRYTVLLLAILLQIVVFGEVPDALTFVGCAVVAAAGIVALNSERLTKTSASSPEVARP